METNELIQDLAMMLTVVGFVSILFTRFGWPKVIGFILAGAFLGPHTFGGSFLMNVKSIDVIGQLGVVFLMFGMGLEFSLRKFRNVGRVAAPTAVLDIVVMVWLGHFVGTRILGWGHVQSLFLGAAICDSATTLLAKTIDDMGWGGRSFTKYIFGTTILEDVLCIGLIALLTGIASSHGQEWRAVGVSLGSLALFLTGVLVFGILLIPRAMNYVAKLKDDDSLLLTMLGICFFISLIASRLNFSLALGAFLIGTLGAESMALKKIETLCAPLRTVFSSVFFVTVGMMIDPSALVKCLPAVLLVTVLVILFKTLNCTIGSLLMGQDLKNSLQTGIGLAQIGEFAYLIAMIGTGMKVTGQELTQIAVGVSIISMILNPFLLRASDPFADWVIRKMPAHWNAIIEAYGKWFERARHANATPQVLRRIHTHFVIAFMQLALVAIIFIAAKLLAGIDYTVLSPWIEKYKDAFLWIAASLLMVPCSVFLFFRCRMIGDAFADVFIPEKVRKQRWGIAFRHLNIFFTTAIGITALFAETAALSGTIAPKETPVRIAMGVLLLLIAVFGVKRIRRLGAESLTILQDVLTKDSEPETSAPTTAELLDVHSERIIIPRGAVVTGKSLRELRLRNVSGASVIGIERGNGKIVNPTAEERLLEGDRVLLLGDGAQITRASQFLQQASDKYL
jgi:CPA2 family monovalent cation:H+ antiporter-2